MRAKKPQLRVTFTFTACESDPHESERAPVFVTQPRSSTFLFSTVSLSLSLCVCGLGVISVGRIVKSELCLYRRLEMSHTLTYTPPTHAFVYREEACKITYYKQVAYVTQAFTEHTPLTSTHTIHRHDNTHQQMDKH